MSAPTNNSKCYNSYSCVLSVLVIVFMFGSIMWDLLVTKPAMRESIEEIKTEVQVINQKLDLKDNAKDSTFVVTLDSIM